MKKFKNMLCGLSALVLTGTMLGAAMPVSAETAPLRGDFDGNGEVELEDAMLTLQAYVDNIAGKDVQLLPQQKTAADINEDGEVDVVDAMYILMYYVYNAVADLETTWEDLLRPVTDQARAQDVMEKLMDGLVAHDVDALFAYTDLREILSIIEGADFSEEELRAELEEKASGIESYRIIGSRKDPETMAEYNEQVIEIRANAEEALADDPDEETRIVAERILQYLQPLDGLYVFEVEAMIDGEPEVDEMQVANHSGKWYVDTLLIDMLVGTAKMSKISSANTAAKSVYNAFNTAAVDLDMENYPIDLLNGEYDLKPADFANIKKPTAENVAAEQTMLAVMCYQASQYLSEITELTQIAVYLEGGVCKYVAVAKDFSGKLWFGCYPNSLDSVAYEDIHSIEDALSYAKTYGQK